MLTMCYNEKAQQNDLGKETQKNVRENVTYIY